ncbi:hypothetical protein OHA63_15170 [Streptomyces anulatus]|uniref:hypothetical protein n=1 Tax=Streptomyces anulatus TaxID=1892 RepID=UPI002E3243A2|nr:hypothetical protein [Streptomyces anulatus]
MLIARCNDIDPDPVVELSDDTVHRHLPAHAEPVIGALVRLLAVPANGGAQRAS